MREADKDRFLATLFAPAKYRRALFALYAFNVEIARVRELAREPMPGEIRLQWWRDVFAGAGPRRRAGQSGRGRAARHRRALSPAAAEAHRPDRGARVRSLRRPDGVIVRARGLCGEDVVRAHGTRVDDTQRGSRRRRRGACRPAGPCRHPARRLCGACRAPLYVPSRLLDPPPPAAAPPAIQRSRSASARGQSARFLASALSGPRSRLPSVAFGASVRSAGTGRN